MRCSELILSLTIAKEWTVGPFLMVQWLGLHAFTAVGTGLIPGQGTNIHMPYSQKKKRREREGDFLKQNKNTVYQLKIIWEKWQIKKKKWTVVVVSLSIQWVRSLAAGSDSSISHLKQSQLLTSAASVASSMT